MSACISQHGEYSEHDTAGGFACVLCGVFDETAALARIERLTVERDEVCAEVTAEAERARQAEAERDSLQRIINGYDRTPAEQRAAGAEERAERAEAAARQAKAEALREAAEDVPINLASSTRIMSDGYPSAFINTNDEAAEMVRAWLRTLAGRIEGGGR